LDNISKGKYGEVKALNYLRGIGYTILEINWETQIGELDIVAEADGTIVFVEVKARASYKYGSPAEAVNYYKQRKLSMMAAQYIKMKKLIGKKARFDVIEIVGENINHIVNAFDSQISF
jgi:putative endonuclease